MLKRYQILLATWQADYLKLVAEGFDESFSEAVRGAVCIAIMCMIPKMFPEYKSSFPVEKVKDMLEKTMRKGNQEEKHKSLSNLYFEARKASEYAIKKREQENKEK